MKKINKPCISLSNNKTGYTKVEWIPDFKRFGITKYSKNILKLYCKYVVDYAMLVSKSNVKVYFNDVLIDIKNLEDYSKLYFDKESKNNDKLYIKDKNNEIYLLPLSYTNNKFKQVSFVNGVYTKDGGTHVDAWIKSLLKPVVDKLSKSKDFTITLNEIKKYFMLFVNVTLARPEFESQSKNCLQSSVNVQTKNTDVKKILKWEIIEDIKRIKELNL